MIKAEFSKKLRYLRRQLWWLDVVYPLALGISLFAALSFVIYSGPRQSRLSLLLEKRLMEFSLALASGQAPEHPGQVVVVSIQDATGKEQGHHGANQVIDSYIESIERLSAAGVPLIFIYWEADDRSGYDRVFERLQKTLVATRKETRTFFVASSHHIEQIPISIRQQSVWLNDSPCDEPQEVQIDCSYVPTYDSWVIQRILENVSPRLAGQAPTAAWVSNQMANGFPSYLLNLSPPTTIARTTLAAIIDNPTAVRKAKIAFVSASADDARNVAKVAGGSSHVHISGVRTVYERDSGEHAGVRLPVFWAMIAQMFIDEGMVRLPSDALVIVYTALICALLAAATLLGFGYRGILVFVAFTFVAPLLNAAAVRSIQVYVPLFDSYYFGLLVLIVTGLVRLSIVTIERWRIKAQMRMQSHVVDLKSNFVSLLSHNLNTPVAKMQGMLDLLRKQTVNTPAGVVTTTADALATQLELAIRGVLIAAAVEEGVLNEVARRPDHILSEFGAAATNNLRRLGVTISLKPLRCDDESLLFLPMNFDMRAVTGALTSLAALFHSADNAVDLTVAMTVIADAEGPLLTVDFGATNGFPEAVAVALLQSDTKRQVRTVGGDQFFAEVQAVFVKAVVGSYGGRIDVEPAGQGGKVRVTLRPSSRSIPAVESTGPSPTLA